ncbi:MAG TPA: hypothetical protein VIA18_29855, partial [Polyangia bacterium]|nr:hypothetical protein [Polyangia bacterium]
MSMDLEEMERRWQAHDRALERSLALNVKVVRALGAGQARTTLERLTLTIVATLAVNAIAVALLGSHLAARITQPRFLLPTLVLFLPALAIVAGDVRQLVRVRTIDVDGPIVAMQKALEQLHLQRLRTLRNILTLSPLAWPPLIIVGLDALFGVDAYVVLGGRYLLANVVFGLAMIPLVRWLAHVYSDKASRSPWLQRLARG